MILNLSQYNFQNYVCVAIMISPLAWSRKIWSPLKIPTLPLKISISLCLWNFQNFFSTFKLGRERHYTDSNIDFYSSFLEIQVQ